MTIGITPDIKTTLDRLGKVTPSDDLSLEAIKEILLEDPSRGPGPLLNSAPLLAFNLGKLMEATATLPAMDGDTLANIVNSVGRIVAGVLEHIPHVVPVGTITYVATAQAYQKDKAFPRENQDGRRPVMTEDQLTIHEDHLRLFEKCLKGLPEDQVKRLAQGCVWAAEKEETPKPIALNLVHALGYLDRMVGERISILPYREALLRVAKNPSAYGKPYIHSVPDGGLG